MSASQNDEDSRLWLEEVDGEAALSWVRQQNEVTDQRLMSSESFRLTRQRLNAIYNAPDKIPYVMQRGNYLYNFWRDQEHERGVWRRTSWDSYVSDEPVWELVLDLDALAEAEEENWVWRGSALLFPDCRHCMIKLSCGGADASVWREFDLTGKTFVEDGFHLSQSKSSLSWVDRNTLLVSYGGDEESVTSSGYPRVIKRWERGAAIDDAETIFEGPVEDMMVSSSYDVTPGWERGFIHHRLSFYKYTHYELTPKGLWKLPKPDDANASIYKSWIFLSLRSDWNCQGLSYSSGSLIVARYDAFKFGKPEFEVLFEPDDASTLLFYDITMDFVVLNILEDVVNRVEVLAYRKSKWERFGVTGLPDNAKVSASAVNRFENNAVWISVNGFLTPTSVWHAEIDQVPQRLKSGRPRFNSTGCKVSQRFATSKDGTRIPYFEVLSDGAKTGNPRPTILNGYGGFKSSRLPGYISTQGAAWLEGGGNYVVANIRGGGEYGPRWHKAACKENRHKAYEDFVAVAEDLVQRGITTRSSLGCMGGSNGGLLVGNMYTQYPDRFGAIVCQVPLLDMQRYHKLLAGASWMDEYGDPDNPEEWRFIEKFSPYHNIDPEKHYPPILLATSTRDDRVHPAHARKMAHALLEAGKDVIYFENIEGGHGAAANNDQAARRSALVYEFFWKNLSGEPRSEVL